MKFGGNSTPRDERIPRVEPRDGKFIQWTGPNTEPETYEYVHGRLCGIELRTLNLTDRTTIFCDIHFVMPDGTRFCISTPASGSTAADIVSRLVNVKDYNNVIRVNAWKREENSKYTNITMYEKKSFEENEAGEKIPFVELPKTRRVQNGFSTQIDSSERDNQVMKYITEINAKLEALGLKLSGSKSPAAPADDDDMPAGESYAPNTYEG